MSVNRVRFPRGEYLEIPAMLRLGDRVQHKQRHFVVVRAIYVIDMDSWFFEVEKVTRPDDEVPTSIAKEGD